MHARAIFRKNTRPFGNVLHTSQRKYCILLDYRFDEKEMSHGIDKRTGTYSCFIEELGRISASSGEYVTVKMDRWFYYIDRAKLMLIKGTYSKEELKKIVDRCDHADLLERAGKSPDVDCPRHFTMVCRPLDLVRLARDILKLYKEYERVY